jgi:hypothetical protein
VRDEFPGKVKAVLALRAAGRCSNPDCMAVTSGPELVPDRAVNVGVAAHITAASPGGPRYDPALTPAQRAAAPNGIWLCQRCAKLIDSDVPRYTGNVLRGWKSRAEGLASQMLASGARSVAGGQPGHDVLEWSVREFPPSAAGVHRAVGSDSPPGNRSQGTKDDTKGEWRALPLYVSRDHDAELRDRLAAAAPDGGLVLLTGRSCTGKTRSAWEAIQSDAFRGWRVIRPAGASALRSAAGSGKIRPQTIVWLDEMQLFLGGDHEDGLTADDLRTLWARHGQVVVIGIIWPDLYDDFFRRPGAGKKSTDRARQVLEMASPPVRVPDGLGEAEVERAQRQATADETIRWALRHSDQGLTQILAGAPWLVQRWEQPRSGYTRSVLAAAAAAARLGIRDGVSPEFLREAARAYFPSRRAAPAGWFADSVAEATELIRDSVCALIPEPAADDDDRVRYRLTDYLVQYTSAGHGLEPVPERVWRALVAEAGAPPRRRDLVYAARQRLLYGIAEPLLRQALGDDAGWARPELASLLAFQGRHDEATELEHAAGDEGEDPADRGTPDPGEVRTLAIAGLHLQGLSGELCTLAESGIPLALYWAVDLLAHQDRLPEAFRLAVRLGAAEPRARSLWQLLAGNVRDPEAVAGLSRRVEDERQAGEGLAGLLLGRYRDEAMLLAQQDPHLLVNLALLLDASGQAGDAAGLLRGCRTEDPCQCPAIALATLLAQAGHADEAIAVLKAIPEPSPGLPWQRRRPEGALARILYQHRREAELEAMAAGSAPALREWARVLAGRGQVDRAAQAFYTAAIWLLDRGPLVEMGVMLADHGQVERAFRDVGQCSAEIFGSDCSSALAAELAGQGRLEDLRQAAASPFPDYSVDHFSARAYLSALLAAQQPAAELARRTVSGDPDAADALILLAATGYLAHASEFRRFGLRPDGTLSLGEPHDQGIMPSTQEKPDRAVLLGSLPLLNLD